MRTALFVPACSLMILSACMVTSRPGGGVEIIPILPAIVELDVEGHYTHQGYHYFYAGDRWYYSNSLRGQRSELPRSHWPRETRRAGENRPR